MPVVPVFLSLYVGRELLNREYQMLLSVRWICWLLWLLWWDRVIRIVPTARILYRPSWERTEKGRNELVIEGMLDYAYRQGDWVMIPPYPGGNRTYELYNIRKDPEQKNDLSESEPKVLRRMMMRFEELKRETGKKTNF